MKYRRIWMVFLILGVLRPVNAQTSGLSHATSVPVGERVANYLQAVMSSASAMINAKSQGGLLSSHSPYQWSFEYDPQHQVIDVNTVGALDKAADAKPILEQTQKLVLQLNHTIQNFYGVTLKPADLAISFIDIKSGQVVLRLINGQYKP